jgi:hypothetical protein
LARFVGLAYLGIAVLAFYAKFGILDPLLVGSPATVFKQLQDAEASFRLATAAFLLMLVLDAIVAIGLFVLLRSAGPALALFALATHLTYTIVHAVGVVSLATIPALLSEPPGAAAVVVGAQLEIHAQSFMLGLAFFGLHLCAAGVLVWRAPWFPTVFGVLLIGAGIGYLVDTLVAISLVESASIRRVTELWVIVVAIAGEMGFALWLLIRGVPARLWPSSKDRLAVHPVS